MFIAILNNTGRKKMLAAAAMAVLAVTSGSVAQAEGRGGHHKSGVHKKHGTGKRQARIERSLKHLEETGNFRKETLDEMRRKMANQKVDKALLQRRRDALQNQRGQDRIQPTERRLGGRVDRGIDADGSRERAAQRGGRTVGGGGGSFGRASPGRRGVAAPTPPAINIPKERITGGMPDLPNLNPRLSNDRQRGSATVRDITDEESDEIDQRNEEREARENLWLGSAGGGIDSAGGGGGGGFGGGGIIGGGALGGSGGGTRTPSVTITDIK